MQDGGKHIRYVKQLYFLFQILFPSCLPDTDSQNFIHNSESGASDDAPPTVQLRFWASPCMRNVDLPTVDQQLSSRFISRVWVKGRFHRTPQGNAIIIGNKLLRCNIRRRRCSLSRHTSPASLVRLPKSVFFSFLCLPPKITKCLILCVCVCVSASPSEKWNFVEQVRKHGVLWRRVFCHVVK